MGDPQPSATAGPALTRGEVEDLLRSPNQLMSDAVLQRRFPHIAASARMADLPLSVRAQNRLRDLQKQRGLADLSHLSRFTIGELLRLKNFGRKSLVNLLTSLLPVIVDPGVVVAGAAAHARQPLSVALTRAAERLRAQPYSAHLRCSDPRFRAEASTLLYIANSSGDDAALDVSASLRAVAHRLVGRTYESSPPDSTLDAICKIRRKVARARHLPLEQELEEILRGIASGRNVAIALSFWGWSGHGVKTLQATGDSFHITRERVRQIADKFSQKIKRARPFAPTLGRVVIHISRRSPAAVEDIETELYRCGLTRAPFRIDGIVSAARLSSLSVPFVIEKHHGIRTVVHHEDVGLTKSIVRAARKVVSHAGLGNVTDLCERLQGETGASVSNPVVRRVLQSLASLRWLDEQSEWFFLDEVPRNHLVTLITKVLSVAPRIHVNEMRSAIASDHRGMGFAPPKPVVMEFCRIACECSTEGDNIIAKHPPSVKAVLSTFEQLAYSVLAEHGPLLHRSEFERRCIERGMNPSTFLNYLTKLPILARYAHGIYGLRGAPIAPGDVERCIPAPTRRLRDHGWTPDARPWLAVELSPAALSTGVITVPSAIQRFIAGRYLLRTQDGSEVGTLVITKHAGWGLGPLFRRRGGEAGDVVMLTFDLQRHEAEVRIGTKEDMLISAEISEPALL